MEGRAIARPNELDLATFVLSVASPSMEGRAIARPNLPHRFAARSPT